MKLTQQRFKKKEIVEPNLKITNTRLLIKSGGKKGLWINPNGIPEKIKKVLNL